MRHHLLFLTLVCGAMLPCLQQSLYAQDPWLQNPRLNPQLMRKGMDGVIQWNAVHPREVTALSVPKDWNRWVDSLWGPGLPTTDKLTIFDTYWNNIDRYFGGFPNLPVDWNALRNHYRPLVGAGVSRGRFYGIMSHMSEALQEHHTWVVDKGVDSSFYDGGYLWPHERIPLVLYGGYGATTSGMGVAPMPDSSLFVYRAQQGHPLGIQPGDIILGYDGRRWVDILRAIDSTEVPIARLYCVFGSTPEGYEYTRLNAASMNWWMFDTMDVVKYSTGDTVHLSTQILMDMPVNWDSLYCMDEIPVAGVPEPDALHDNWCSWGVVEGTSIGYIYLWGEMYPSIGSQFEQAVRELMHTTTGLIIDMRGNWGGKPNCVNAAFSLLFNENMDTNFDVAHRSSTTDHFAFSHEASSSSVLLGPFSPTPDIYDHPIAVLTGPACISAGDYTAFRLTFHPMSRSFGKRTNGVPVDGYYVMGTLVRNPWEQQIPKGSAYSHSNDGEYLIHKGVPVDEEVWLTREGAAHGVDDVVQRAVQWITTLTYAHDITLDRHYAHPGADSLCVTAPLANPLSHSVALSATITDGAGVLLDSLQMFDDGAHGDGLAGDGRWGCYVRPTPVSETFYKVAIRTEDLDLKTYRRLPDVARFTTAGPLTLDSVSCTFFGDRWLMLAPYVKNNGQSAIITGAQIAFRSNDSCVNTIASPSLSLLDIPPGEVRSSQGGVTTNISYDSSKCPRGYIDLAAEMSIGAITYWIDSVRVYLKSTGVPDIASIPTAYSLEQNYPNPFNPSTTITYELPQSSDVRLSVFDMLGREVSVLVNERRDAGAYDVQFDAAGLSSGVYFYRLQAGDFVQAKTFVLMK
jgi:hypothetical protein